MKIVDKIAAVLLTLLGLTHSAFTFAYAHKGAGAINAAMFLGAGIAIVLGGVLNGVRIARPGDSLLRNVSLGANILMTIFCLAVLHAIGSGVSKAPQTVVVTTVVVIELIFSAVPRG
jgi:hypothetical protein